MPGNPAASGLIADFDGNIVGQTGYNGEVVNRFGERLGRVDAKGVFFDANGEYKGRCSNAARPSAMTARFSVTA